MPYCYSTISLFYSLLPLSLPLATTRTLTILFSLSLPTFYIIVMNAGTWSWATVFPYNMVEVRHI